MNNRNTSNRRYRHGNGNCHNHNYGRVKPMRQTVNVPDGVQTLAMVYGISQVWRGIDTTECGFNRGTIFDELDKPFYGDTCKRNCK